MNWRKDGYTISDEAARLDMEAVFGMLNETYWAAGRSKEIIGQSMAHSLCFGLYDDNANKQVGFLRAVTDYTTYAWICDVVVHPSYRGRGFGKWLMACMLEHPALSVTNKMLATRDAHGLYEQFGFERREALRLAAVPVQA